LTPGNKANPGFRLDIEDMYPLFRENFVQPQLFEGTLYHVSQVDWNEFQLFERVGIQFMNELNFPNGIGYGVNDYNDLMNLIYVSPRDQYYVKEIKWIELIEKAGMKSYIHPASYEIIIKRKIYKALICLFPQLHTFLTMLQMLF
jgi:hypothetical protein